MGGDLGDFVGHHTLPHQHRGQHQSMRNSGTTSPPLPPPPPPEHDENSQFGRPGQFGAIMPIVPDEDDLPGWVPKNYIEKGLFLGFIHTRNLYVSRSLSINYNFFFFFTMFENIACDKFDIFL